MQKVMEREIEKFVPKFTFRRRYGIWADDRYQQFLSYVSEKLEEVIDSESELVSLSLVKDWKDQGGNRHVSIRGSIERRGESAEVGAEIVWLKKLKTFRGTFWSKLNPKSDTELFSEAKVFFHAGRYVEFLTLARYLESAYSANHIYKRMVSIAERRV